MLNTAAIKNNYFMQYSQTKKRKHSKSFVCLNVLNIYLFAVFALRIEAIEIIYKYIIMAMLIALLFFLILNQLFSIKYMSYKGVLLLSFIFFGTLSYLYNFYGLERLIGLIDILLMLMLFNKYPLYRHERRVACNLFNVTAIIVLLFCGIFNYYGIISTNTNTLGLLAAMIICVNLIAIKRRRSFFSLILVAVSLLLLLFVYQSRNALLGVIMFVVLSILLRAKNKTFSPKTVFITVIILVAGAIIFTYIYSVVLFPKIGRGKIIILGKDIFSGRQGIWLFAYDLLKGRLIWGVGDNIVAEVERLGLASVFTEMHNQPLGIIVGFGLIVFILFYLAFAAILNSYYNGNKRYNRIPAVFMFVIMTISYFEVYFFSTYTWIPIIIAFALICSLNKRDKVSVGSGYAKNFINKGVIK